jgi:hypothetical protein
VPGRVASSRAGTISLMAISEWRKAELERALTQPVLSRCAFCEWTWEGPLSVGREKAVQHRLKAHPEVKPKRRRPMRNPRSYIQPELKREDVEEINAERRKRAYLIGVEIDG